MPTCADVRT